MVNQELSLFFQLIHNDHYLYLCHNFASTQRCPDFNFTVYQGSIDERRALRYDVLNNRFEKPLNGILATYGLIASTNEDKAFFRKIKFEYCVFDEAHMLKNMNSIRYQSLIKIQVKKLLKEFFRQ